MVAQNPETQPATTPSADTAARNASPSLTGSEGIIYLLQNEAFEAEVVKIGRTERDLAGRIRTLNTGVPLAFTCFRASRVADAAKVEKLLHDVFHPAKRHWRGEFYEVEPWRVVLVLEQYEIEDLTHLAPTPTRDDEASISVTVRGKDRKDNFTFATAGIDVGENLSLVGSSEIKCEVADGGTNVQYGGEIVALSTLTTRLKESSTWLQGIRYWTYEGETLLKRRDRMLGI